MAIYKRRFLFLAPSIILLFIDYYFALIYVIIAGILLFVIENKKSFKKYYHKMFKSKVWQISSLRSLNIWEDLIFRFNGQIKKILLSKNLSTGWHDQIRSHFATMGNTIKGYLKYGFHCSKTDGSIHLDSRTIRWAQLVKKE